MRKNLECSFNVSLNWVRIVSLGVSYRRRGVPPITWRACLATAIWFSIILHRTSFFGNAGPMSKRNGVREAILWLLAHRIELAEGSFVVYFRGVRATHGSRSLIFAVNLQQYHIYMPSYVV